MTSNNENKEYTVGYGKTPVHSRFKSGQSGNTKGRPKRVANIKDTFLRELSRKVKVKEGGQEMKISKQDAFIKALINRSLAGDRHAAREVLVLIARLIGLDGGNGQTMDQLREEDIDIIQSLLNRRAEEK